MIKSLRNRVRPDNLQNQVRAGGKSLARRLYLWCVVLVLGGVALELIGPYLFLDADGMALKERTVLGSDFNARVVSVRVKPGDRVEVGEEILTVQSSETAERIAELSRRISAGTAKASQLRSRLRSLDTLRPIAHERRTRALQSLQKLGDLAKRQLTTAARLSEASRELFEAEREEAQLTAEAQTADQEILAVNTEVAELTRVRDDIRRAYQDGRLTALVAGVIGPKVVSPGQIMKPGEAAVEIFHGELFVVGYLPTNRLFRLKIGDRVVVTDGASRAIGHIERIEATAAALPPEFQSAFRGVERQQVARVVLDEDDRVFAVQAKVRVVGLFTPSSAFSLVKSTFQSIASLARRIAGLPESELDRTTRIAGVPPAPPPGPTIVATRPSDDDDDITTGTVTPRPPPVDTDDDTVAPPPMPTELDREEITGSITPPARDDAAAPAPPEEPFDRAAAGPGRIYALGEP